MKNEKEIREKLKPFVKNNRAYICPKCKNQVEVKANPLGKHTCEHCNYKGSYLQYPTKSYLDIVIDLLKGLFNVF